MAMFFDPFQELDRLTGALYRRAASGLAMPVDLYREGDRFVLTADLPGVDPGSVDVSVDGQTLTLRAERSVLGADGVEWLVRERPDASFVRQFTLGDGIDADGISAHYTNGVLSVVIPMTERTKPRKVQISTRQSAQKSVAAGTEERRTQPLQQGGQTVA